MTKDSFLILMLTGNTEGVWDKSKQQTTLYNESIVGKYRNSKE